MLGARVSAAADETSALRATVEQMRDEVQRLDRALQITREQLDWWPRPLTKSVLPHRPSSLTLSPCMRLYFAHICR